MCSQITHNDPPKATFTTMALLPMACLLHLLQLFSNPCPLSISHNVVLKRNIFSRKRIKGEMEEDRLPNHTMVKISILGDPISRGHTSNFCKTRRYMSRRARGIGFHKGLDSLLVSLTADSFHYVTRLIAGTGNLFTEKVSKRDIFYVFRKYGKLAQISMKSAYGFVQYHNAESCFQAMQNEEGTEIQGRKIRKEDRT
jgi:RNA recognition motif-containing protein